jgi:RNA polymerase-binding transcription factor
MVDPNTGIDRPCGPCEMKLSRSANLPSKCGGLAAQTKDWMACIRMDKKTLDYFRDLLLEQRRVATADVRADQATALQGDDGVQDTGDMSELDVNKSTAFDLGGRQLHMIEEIDQALLRIEVGTYGQCARCGKPIDAERLKAMPSAKYDAECQAAREVFQGVEEMPTL